MRVVAAFTLFIAACTAAPPSKVEGAPKRPPDESYQVGGGITHRVLVWKCDERNERTTMTQTCGEGPGGCSAWFVDRTLCPLEPAGRDATRTASERDFDRGPKQPIPEGSGWR